MPLPKAPYHMYLLRDQTITNFGYDHETNTNYTFNNLGYRSMVEFVEDASPVIILGNTISFGLGLPIEKTFAGIMSQALDYPIYNFAWGCYGHTNNDQLLLLQHILTVLKPRHVIFQINNLNRIRNNGQVSFDNPDEIVISEFNKFSQEIQKVLKTTPHDFLHWDEKTYPVNLPHCRILNKYHVDSSPVRNKNTFGPRTHKLIAHSILQGIK